MIGRGFAHQAWPGRLLAAWQAAISLLGLLGLVMWLPSIGRPFPGILYKYQRERNALFVYFETGASFPGIQAGLRVNDRILSVNGLPGTQDGIDEAVREAAGAAPGKQVLLYEVERRGQQLTIPVPLTRLTLNQLLDAKLPLAVLGYSYLLLALLVWRARPRERVNQLFALFGTLVAGLCLSIGYAGLVSRPPIPSTVPDLILWQPGTPLACAVLWHFFCVFPKAERTSWVYRTRQAGYPPAVLVVLFFAYQQLFPRHLPSAHLSLGVSLLVLGWLAAVLLAGFLRLALVFRRDPAQRVRRQISAMLIGGCLGLFPPLIPLFAFFLGRNASVVFGSSLYYLGLLFPLAVAYAILRYNLFSSKSAILALLILAGFSVVAANVLYHLFAYILGWQTAFLPLLLACLLTGIAWEVRSPVRHLFDRLFNRAAHDYRALSSFSEVLLSVPGHARTYADLCRVLAERMGLGQVSLWIIDRADARLRKVAECGSDLPASVPFSGPDAVELDSAAPQPARADDAGARVWARLLPGVPAAVYVPLSGQAACLGVLVAGARWNEEPMDGEDLALLDLMSHQLSLKLLADKQTAELHQVPGRIARAQEEERYELSKDLHDTVQQFLGALPFLLEAAARAAREAPEDAVQVLDRCQGLAQLASQDLRAIRSRLSPGPLEGRDLSSALLALVEAIPRLDGPHVTLDADDDLDRGLPPQAKITLYRVVQQALDNALAHAHAERILIALHRADGRVLFGVVDDGCGFDAGATFQAGRRGHDGLWIMRDRIALVGGELSVRSSPRRGTEISGWVPLAGPAAHDT